MSVAETTPMTRPRSSSTTALPSAQPRIRGSRVSSGSSGPAVGTARPAAPLLTLLPRMRGCADGRAVVLDERGRVIGVVSATDISRALQLADLRSFHAYPPPRGADLTTVGPPAARAAGSSGSDIPRLS